MAMNKLSVPALLLLASLLATACGGGKQEKPQADEDVALTQTRYVAPEAGVTVYSQPDFQSKETGRLDFAQQVLVLEESGMGAEKGGKKGEWVQVQTDSITGWAFSLDLAAKKPAPKMASEADTVLAANTTTPRSEATGSQMTVLDMNARSSQNTLLTYGGGMQDAKVNAANLEPWRLDSTQSQEAYLGTYEGAFEAELIKLVLMDSEDGLNSLASYQREYFNDEGMAEFESGDVALNKLRLQGNRLKWTRTLGVQETRGQFVKWDGQQGLLVVDTTEGQPYFTLLKKTK